MFNSLIFQLQNIAYSSSKPCELTISECQKTLNEFILVFKISGSLDLKFYVYTFILYDLTLYINYY